MLVNITIKRFGMHGLFVPDNINGVSLPLQDTPIQLTGKKTGIVSGRFSLNKTSSTDRVAPIISNLSW